MSAYFTFSLRALLLATALAFAAHTADARSATEPSQPAARTTARTKTDAPASERDNGAIEGVVIVVAVIGVVIVLAWIASRFGDSR